MTAVQTADEKYFVLNGSKKWITNGTFADYFTVAAKTSDSGYAGISLFLVEKTMPGVSVRKMKVIICLLILK